MRDQTASVPVRLDPDALTLNGHHVAELRALVARSRNWATTAAERADAQMRACSYLAVVIGVDR
jgi:hypothetical protein